ncbi:helix-turn-helix transcriptional regulator [Gayadomonas joobiniege]|uniref:helix-turn-helix transcriptional regulator n=1 Tax=Gayadomonas joobiniege TaxID=1234606 RepID=UPI00037A8E36|nr:AlpA family phage regulatory protein [Gayadomonas joobiniege]
MNITELTQSRMVNAKQITQLLGVSISTLEQHMKKRGFPKPVTPAGCKRLWSLKAVEGWIEQKQEAA